MKRMLTFVALLLVAGFAFGQETEFFPVAAPTLVWDESPGTALPGDVLEYEVFVWDRLNGEIEVQPVGLLTLRRALSHISLVRFGFRCRTLRACGTQR